MLKAIVAKVVRAAAKVGRVGCALADEFRGSVRAASLVVAKRAVGAMFGVATVIFLAPAASILVVNDAAAQAQTCTAQNREGGTSTTGCGVCLEGFQEFGNSCERPMDCTAVSGQVPNDDNSACICPDRDVDGTDVSAYPITDGAASSCQLIDNFCRGRGVFARDNFGSLESVAANNPNNPDEKLPDADEAEAAYCRPCASGDEYESFNGGCAVPRNCTVRGQYVNRPDNNNECVCPVGQRGRSDNEYERAAIFSIPGDSPTRTCAPELPAATGHYDSADCRSAGWDVEYWAVTVAASENPNDLEMQGGFHLVESCRIRVQFVTAASLDVSGQLRTTDDPAYAGYQNSCYLRHNTGADVPGAVGAAGNLSCDDPALFGTAGLPMRPDSFNVQRSDALFVISTMTADNADGRIFFGDSVVRLAGAAPVEPVDPGTPDPGAPDPGAPDPGGPSEPVAASAPSGGGGGAGPIAGGGILLVALAYYAFSGQESGASFAFTPRARYAIEDDIAYYRYGSRLEFRQDEWTLWWTADESRRGDAGSVRGYGYGGQWANDILRASAGVNYDEDSADMRAGLEAEWTLSNWVFRPSYRFRALSDEAGEWEIRNGLDFAAKLTQAGWEVRPSVNAGGLWSGGSLEADIGLQVGREF